MTAHKSLQFTQWFKPRIKFNFLECRQLGCVKNPPGPRGKATERDLHTSIEEEIGRAHV